MYIALDLVTGGLVSVMIELSGRLQVLAGVIPALVIIHVSGLATSTVYKTTGAFHPERRPPREQDTGRLLYTPWFLCAGVLGAVVVLMSNEVYQRGGVVLTLMGTLAGQTLAAFALERSRWLEGRTSPRLQRLISLSLILPGAAVIGLVDRVGLAWIALSWVPGVVLMVQQMMNSRIAVRFGRRNMLLLNYATALSALAVAVCVEPASISQIVRAVDHAPAVLLLGGGVLGVAVTAFAAFLLTRAPALQITLGIYGGQIAVGILLDVVARRPFMAPNAIGITMVILGLLAGWVRNRRPRPRAEG